MSAHLTDSRTVRIADPLNIYNGYCGVIRDGVCGVYIVDLPGHGATISTTVRGDRLEIVERFQEGFIA